MLKLHVLNVEHGSSVVVEFDRGGGPVFGLIDSNLRSGEQIPRGLTKLRALGARRLSFVCLTHPHKDHYKGLFSIIQAFPDAIDYFYSCPFGDLLREPERLKKFAAKLLKINKLSEAAPRQEALELLQIIKWAHDSAREQKLDWRECAGENLQLSPPGFAGLEIATILPPNKVKGHYIQQIERSDGLITGTLNENTISLAFRFGYRGGVGSTRRRWYSIELA